MHEFSNLHLLIHRWDEWVRDDRIKKWNEENLKLSKELKIAALAQQKRAADAQAQKKVHSASSTNGKEVTASNGKEVTAAPEKEPAVTASRGQKRTREADAEKDEAYTPTLHLQVPDLLKARLVDDWEWVTKDQRLVPLPREGHTVADILQEYRLSVPMKRPGSAEAEIFEEFMAGIQTYFDKCLGTILLYRFERQQYADIRKKYPEDVKMSDVYGAEHLLRLFVSMQELVAQTQMDPQAVAVLRNYLQDLMKFLARNLGTFFVKEYDVTAPSYSRILHLS